MVLKNPGQLGMFRNLRLHEERAHVRIDPGGEQSDRHLAPALAKLVGIVRDRDRVIVDDAEDRLVLVLQPRPSS